jgi:hypothetical protein
MNRDSGNSSWSSAWRFRIRRQINIVIVSTLGLYSCSDVPEPGTPRRDPSPLFGDLRSYRTFEEIKHQLPERSTWQIRWEDESKARPGCPRFKELTFAVGADHLGQHGDLQLTFINDRLLSTAFMPDDFASYVSRLEQGGVKFDGDGEADIPPATLVWQYDRKSPIRPFVGWRDTRFRTQVDAWVRSCA